MRGLAPGANPGPVSSIPKLCGGRLEPQADHCQAGCRCAGPDAIAPMQRSIDGPLRPRVLSPKYYNSRAYTIFGGAAVQMGLTAQTLTGN